MAHTVIEKTTEAVVDPRAFAVQVARLPCTILATGLGEGEEVSVHFSPDGGNTWEPLKRNGQAVTLTEDNNISKIDSPILLGVTKSATALPAGVFVSATDSL